ncbi:5'-nucleotidase C-terminal domain-containing protein [Nitriliruptor alkaliphilus]|uniref:5'-nucleotidase C-terminal domain-containing protein n=1 Tax=Nitriliruptor alkaliphilus TaxID=427918 RepID=UPI0006985E58|nr:5'-nucleotidase C-terminal domain-containing protein [Nitriliruptor alkaliphilus]
MMRRFTISSLAAVMVLGTVTLPAAAQDAGSLACPDGAPSSGFHDVPAANVHSDAIDCGAALGLIRGKTSTTFEPHTSVTRGQVASLLARTLDEIDAGLPGVADAPTFPDIGPPHGDNIRRLAAAGIVQGRTDGSYGPQDAVRRDQLASLFVRAFEFTLGDELVPDARNYFSDVRTGVHAENIDLAFELGILRGKTDGRFAPLDATRRDQAASVVIRFLDELIAILEAPFDLTVLHINDGESALLPDESAGFPGAARFVHDLKQEQAAAVEDFFAGQVTISAGDNFLAGPRLNASIDQDLDPFYDALVYTEGGFDAMTIGNHEFDFGPDFLAAFIEAADDIPFISANLDVSGEPSLAALEDAGRIGASTMLRTVGRDIAVVGATTELLPTISSPGNVTVSDVLPAVQAEVDAARDAGADIVIVSSHLQDLDNEIELVPQLSGVDAVVGGGGGESLGDDYPLLVENADGDVIPVVTVPGNYSDIGRLVLEFDGDGSMSIGAASELVPVPLEGTRDAFISNNVEAPVAAYVEALATNVIGTTEVPLDGIRDSVRTRETNLGNMLVDSLFYEADQVAGVDVDLALQNGGGIRNDGVIPAGNITELDTFNVAAFTNFVAYAEVTGEDIADALEIAVAAQPNPAGANGQWSGIEFSFDASEPVGSRIVDAKITRGDADATNHVMLVIGGVLQPAAAAEVFTIASIDFLLDGGDGYFEDLDFDRVAGVTYQQSLANLIQRESPINASNYPDLTVDEDEYTRWGPVSEFTVTPLP